MSSKQIFGNIIAVATLVLSALYSGGALSAETVSADDPRTQKKS